MNDLKSREDFKTWALTTGFEDHHFGLRQDGEFADYDVRRLWWPWKASRECLVIEPEWPDHYSYTNPDCAGAAILDCRSAFNVSAREAGVKTK